jgi:hypothetical protein
VNGTAIERNVSTFMAMGEEGTLTDIYMGLKRTHLI